MAPKTNIKFFLNGMTISQVMQLSLLSAFSHMHAMVEAARAQEREDMQHAYVDAIFHGVMTAPAP